MSVLISTRVWQDASVGGSELLVMVAIADIAHDDGVAFISYTDLAEKVRLSDRQAKRVVRKLVEAGQLEVVQQGGVIGDRRFANVYRVTPGPRRGDILSPGDAHDTHRVSPTTPGVGDASDTGPVSQMSHHTSLERNKDSLRESSVVEPEPVEAWRRKSAVDAVFTAWLEAANPPMKKLTAARERDVRRLLNATEDVDYAVKAIRGFVSSSSAVDKSVGALVRTGPQTGSLASRLDFFAQKSPDASSPSSSRFPQGIDDMTRSRLRAVLGEIDEAEAKGDDDWKQQAIENVPAGFHAVTADGRWKIERA